MGFPPLEGDVGEGLVKGGDEGNPLGGLVLGRFVIIPGVVIEGHSGCPGVYSRQKIKKVLPNNIVEGNFVAALARDSLFCHAPSILCVSTHTYVRTGGPSHLLLLRRLSKSNPTH